VPPRPRRPKQQTKEARQQNRRLPRVRCGKKWPNCALRAGKCGSGASKKMLLGEQCALSSVPRPLLGQGRAA
jgi:hypothetical protein